MVARLQPPRGAGPPVQGPERTGDRPVQTDLPADRRKRRRKRPARLRHWGIFDLLFVEVDRLDGLGDAEKQRVKADLSRFFKTRPDGSGTGDPRPSPSAPTTAPPVGDPVAAGRPSDPDPRDSALARMALPVDSRRTFDALMASLRLARQFRDCVALDTASGRRIARYVKALLIVHADRFEPRLRLDV